MWITLAIGFLIVASATGAEDGSAKAAPDAVPNAIPEFDGKVPSPEQLLEILESMSGLTDEERANLKRDLLKNIETTVEQVAESNDLTMQTVILLSLLGVVALIFVFFVYKLFKLLSEREAKREEKRKQKQMKKKK